LRNAGEEGLCSTISRTAAACSRKDISKRQHTENPPLQNSECSTGYTGERLASSTARAIPTNSIPQGKLFPMQAN
jgi:hypothetical protein